MFNERMHRVISFIHFPSQQGKLSREIQGREGKRAAAAEGKRIIRMVVKGGNGARGAREYFKYKANERWEMYCCNEVTRARCCACASER